MTVFSLVAATIDGSVISLLAYNFALVGLALGWILYLIAISVSFFGAYVTVSSLSLTSQLKSAKFFRRSAYHRMAWRGLGKWACILSVVFNVVCLVGVTVVSAVFVRTPYSSSKILSSNISAMPSPPKQMSSTFRTTWSPQC